MAKIKKIECFKCWWGFEGDYIGHTPLVRMLNGNNYIEELLSCFFERLITHLFNDVWILFVSKYPRQIKTYLNSGFNTDVCRNFSPARKSVIN
jgi:hypothetical protein